MSFTAADSAGPAIASSSPADDATGVAVDANIVLTFDENVVVGSGNITLKKSSDDSTVQTMPVGGGNVSVSGAVVTINPSANLTLRKAIIFRLRQQLLMMRAVIPMPALVIQLR